MAIITLPTPPANSMQLKLIRGDAPLSFFGGSEVIVSSRLALWGITLDLAPLKAANSGHLWFSKLVQLARIENVAYIPAVGLVRGTSYSGANPLVEGGSQLGRTLNVDGASPSTTLAYAGEPFSVNNEYKVLTEDAVTNGSGACTLSFEPALRQSPADNATVEIKTPVILARFVNPEAALDTLLSGHYQMSLNMIESVRSSYGS